MRLLVLGGTAWLGRAVSAAALAAGDEVTCLARGVTGTVVDGARLVRADRWSSGAYAGLSAGDWDAVVEVSWQPDLVREAALSLRGRVRHWVYVSSISVYAETGEGRGLEQDPTLEPLARAGRGEVAGEDYGAAKVACELALRDLVPAPRLLVARAGLIVGYGDPSDRFGYWPARFAAAPRRPEILVPPLVTPVQGVDVDDLARWLVSAARAKISGTMDAVGRQHTLGEVVTACRSVLVPRMTPCVVHETGHRFLEENGVRPWVGPDSLPLWLPPASWSLAMRHGNLARSVGLTHRPLADTVAAAGKWERERGLARPRRAGITSEREAQLLGLLG